MIFSIPISVATGRSAFLLVADQGSGEGLDLSQPAINAIDAEWFRAGNTPCFWVPADPSRCDGTNQVREGREVTDSQI